MKRRRQTGRLGMLICAAACLILAAACKPAPPPSKGQTCKATHADGAARLNCYDGVSDAEWATQPKCLDTKDKDKRRECFDEFLQWERDPMSKRQKCKDTFPDDAKKAERLACYDGLSDAEWAMVPNCRDLTNADDRRKCYNDFLQWERDPH